DSANMADRWPGSRDVAGRRRLRVADGGPVAPRLGGPSRWCRATRDSELDTRVFSAVAPDGPAHVAADLDSAGRFPGVDHAPGLRGGDVVARAVLAGAELADAAGALVRDVPGRRHRGPSVRADRVAAREAGSGGTHHRRIPLPNDSSTPSGRCGVGV